MKQNIFARIKNRIWTKRSTSSNPSQWLIDWVRGGKESSAGITINEDNALGYTPFWAAVRIISGAVGALPLITYKRINEDDKEKARNHRVFKLLRYKPNEYMDALTFREMLQAHVLVWGNGYAEIQRDRAGRPYALWPLLPDRTTRKVAEGGTPYYEIRFPAEKEAKQIADYNVLHIKGLGYDGLTGYNVVDYHKEALGLGMATKKYGGKFFGNGGQPGGVLEHPEVLTKEAGDRLKASWYEKHGGLDNAHRVSILEEGMKWHQMAVDPEKAQALETQKFSVDDVARIFNIQPHKIASLERATFTNIEQQNLDFVTQTLFYWLCKWEQECQNKLFLPGEQQTFFAEFLLDAYLRGDIESRYKAYAVGRNWGWLSINDVRAKENMNSIGEKGDDYLEPLNMKPAGEDPPAPVLPKAPEPEPEDEEEEKSRLIEAHRRVFIELCGRIRRKERKALQRELKKPDTFHTAATKFYMTHADYMADILTPAISAYSVSMGGEEIKKYTVIATMPGIGGHATQDEILNAHINKRQKIISGLSDTAKSLADNILEYWSNNATENK